MKPKLTVSVFAVAILPAQLSSQTVARPEFEVASVKPTILKSSTTFGVGNGGGGGQNVTLRSLLALAYGVQEFQISGGPGWIDSDRFDVQGKAADPKSGPDQLRLMLQSLLAERFKLTIHTEAKESSIYTLVAAKSGPKIKLSADQSEEVSGPAKPGAGPNHGAIRMGVGSLVGNGVTLTLFTKLLSQRLDRPVVDKTGLAGRFDIQLQWTPSVGEARYGPAGQVLPPADSSGPSIFSAIQEQLGLKLQSEKASSNILIVDHVEKPSAN